MLKNAQALTVSSKGVVCEQLRGPSEVFVRHE